MTENQYEKITRLYKSIKDLEDNETELSRVIDLPIDIMLGCVTDGIRQYKYEQEGKNLPLDRITDKIFFENQGKIKQIIVDILEGELTKVRVEKNDLKLKFKEVEVKINDNTKTDK
ncbi:hypothetical protein SAMN04487977_101552 [Treponema bryantii]|uniref:Uncharacterized protein n=1 Tax=Treponema bryantii TaxID=163 RepID=A0A1H9B2A9_9SPIR|nr:hypothetical protein [Treponema bryantii]SEP83084.1 hypothetical protein SAMN04487977_101552 [Treponema bryantii]